MKIAVIARKQIESTLINTKKRKTSCKSYICDILRVLHAYIYNLNVIADKQSIFQQISIIH